MQINIKVFYKLMLSFLVCATRHSQSTQHSLHIFAISSEKHGGEVDFFASKWAWKFSTSCSISLGVSSQAWPKYPPKKFTLSLEYLKENVKDELELLPTDKGQRFLQIAVIILDVWPGMPKLPKITSLLFLCNILRKNWAMKLIFCTQISMKACYKLIV